VRLAIRVTALGSEPSRDADVDRIFWMNRSDISGEYPPARKASAIGARSSTEQVAGHAASCSVMRCWNNAWYELRFANSTNPSFTPAMNRLSS
jgi:hypothetical protein